MSGFTSVVESTFRSLSPQTRPFLQLPRLHARCSRPFLLPLVYRRPRILVRHPLRGRLPVARNDRPLFKAARCGSHPRTRLNSPMNSAIPLRRGQKAAEASSASDECKPRGCKFVELCRAPSRRGRCARTSSTWRYDLKYAEAAVGAQTETRGRVFESLR